MRSEKGFFQIHRKWFGGSEQTNKFYGDVYTMALFPMLISWANWKDGEKWEGQKCIKIKRGQVITSYGEMASRLGCSISVIRTRIKRLEISQALRTQNRRQGLLITIENYDFYQDSRNTDSRQDFSDFAGTSQALRRHFAGTSQHENNAIRQYSNNARREDLCSLDFCTENEQNDLSQASGLPTDPKSDLNNNLNQSNLNRDESNEQNNTIDAEIKNDSSQGEFARSSQPAQKADSIPKKAKRLPKKHATPADRQLAIKWAEWSGRMWPSLKTDVDRWSEEIAKTRRLTKFSTEQIEATWEKAKDDDFWCDKLRSPAGLYNKSKKNDERKLINCWTSVFSGEIKHQRILEHARRYDAMGPSTNLMQQEAPF